MTGPDAGHAPHTPDAAVVDGWTGRLLAHLPGPREHDMDRSGLVVGTGWPDGTHLMFGWRSRYRRARGLAARDRDYWWPDPSRPQGWQVVVLSQAQPLGHSHRPCRDAACPNGAVVYPAPDVAVQP